MTSCGSAIKVSPPGARIVIRKHCLHVTSLHVSFRYLLPYYMFRYLLPHYMFRYLSPHYTFPFIIYYLITCFLICYLITCFLICHLITCFLIYISLYLFLDKMCNYEVLNWPKRDSLERAQITLACLWLTDVQLWFQLLAWFLQPTESY